MKRVWYVALALAAAVAVGAVAFPLFATVCGRPRERGGPPSCSHQISSVAMGLMMYAQDWDERWPRAETWATASYGYFKSDMVFRCPQAASRYGYAFNAGLSGSSAAKDRAPGDLVLLFEGDAEAIDAHGGADRVTRQDRHAGKLNWAFADGRVKGLPRSAAVGWKL